MRYDVGNDLDDRQCEEGDSKLMEKAGALVQRVVAENYSLRQNVNAGREQNFWLRNVIYTQVLNLYIYHKSKFDCIFNVNCMIYLARSD